MRKPLGADQTVTITHIIRKGTVSKSYTTVLSGVSCREVSSAHVETPGLCPAGADFVLHLSRPHHSSPLRGC